jgi:hypothetical protein
VVRHKVLVEGPFGPACGARDGGLVARSFVSSCPTACSRRIPTSTSEIPMRSRSRPPPERSRAERAYQPPLAPAIRAVTRALPSASSHPHGTTAYAGSWDQGGASKRPALRVALIEDGVDRFFTAPGCRAWPRPSQVASRPGRRTDRGQRRRERGCGRVLWAGEVGGVSAASRVGLSLGRYDSPQSNGSGTGGPLPLQIGGSHDPAKNYVRLVP